MQLKIGVILFIIVLVVSSLFSQNRNYGTINGSVLDSLNHQSLEFVNISVFDAAQNKVLTGAISDKNGEFLIANIPYGKYRVKITYVGYETKEFSNIIINSEHRNVNIGNIQLCNTGVTLNETEVTSNKIMHNNSIDRKTYNVQQDILSSTGTASDLLQNIPSVQVDIDGNVSLRGSGGVVILINGRPSPLMDKTKAEALRQMPANTIEKIEVITNPSAKYKPDGTTGIINIVMKKDAKPGLNGSVSLNAGNNNRYNGDMSINYNPGKLNLFGNLSLRKDNRNEFSSDVRTHYDLAGKASSYYFNESGNHVKLYSNSLTIGVDYKLDDKNSFSLAGDYYNRDDNGSNLASYSLSDKNKVTTGRNVRVSSNDEFEREYGLMASFEHKFPGEDHKLLTQFGIYISPRQEDNHNTNSYRIPNTTTSHDNALLKTDSYYNQLEIQYSNALTENASFEAGYMGEFNKNDMDFYREYFDPLSNKFVADKSKTNHFICNENIHAAYATYSNSIGNFGLLGGVRLEGSYIKANLVSTGKIIKNEYYNIYPTVHLSYELSDMLQFQLSYSKRANRPEGDNLNPFPNYQDPRNVRAGNPNLKPEFTHSLEFGMQWNNKWFTLIPSVFYRNSYNAITFVTKAINDSTLLTTQENLSKDQAAGFELVVSGGYDFFTLNMSTMAFFEKIDATNLGYGNDKSTTTWSGNISCNFNLSETFVVQLNSNYRSKRLTPQGESNPAFEVNMGIRKDVFDNKLTLIMTVSDLFKTLTRKSMIETSLLHQNTYGFNDSRTIYFGITYHLGQTSKKEKDLQYDNY